MARASIAFAPRLMNDARAALYLGTDIRLLWYLDVRRVMIGKTRLYDARSLDVLDDEDFARAKSRLEADVAWGVAPEPPDCKSVVGFGGRQQIRAKVRREVFARDGQVCRYCGDTKGPFVLDHVFPASRGGASDVENLVVACFSCNSSKRDRTPEEWKGG